MPKVCVQCGGAGPFYHHRARCKACLKAYIAQWQREHPEARRAVKKLYREKHPERVRSSNVNYARKHPDYWLAWRIRNFAKWVSYQERRQKREIVGSLTLKQWRVILEVFGHRCAYCLRDDVRLTMDHVISIRDGGEHTAENVVPACRPCNSRKEARPIFGMARYAA